jgi:hypothetical protein
MYIMYTPKGDKMLIFRGIVKGVRTIQETNRNTGEVFNKVLLGISNPKINGYDGEEIIREFRLSKKQIEAGLVAEYQKLVGKKVDIPVWFQSRGSAKEGNTRVYETWFLEGNGKPLTVHAPVADKVA